MIATVGLVRAVLVIFLLEERRNMTKTTLNNTIDMIY